MRLRWIFFMLLACVVVIVSCAYKGDVIIETKDSFRLISPDFELHPKICNKETTIDNNADETSDKEKEKK